MRSPKVSVCVDVFNYADFLPQAIESVLTQTFPDFELIIVDDCSTDGSFEIARKYAECDSRIRATQNSSNLGMVKNRNACLSLAGGTYVKFIHADDYLCSPDALSRMLALLDSNSALSLVASAMKFVDCDGRPTGQWSCFNGDRLLSGTGVIIRCLRNQRNLIGGPSAVMFRRSRASRGFDANYFHSADLEMWFHLLEQGCFGFIDEPLCAYRWHPRQQTEKDRATLSQAADNKALLATYLAKSYVTKSSIRPWMKRLLTYDATRQYVKRCKKLGLGKETGDALAAYGRRRYYSDWLPWVVKKAVVKQTRFVERQLEGRKSEAHTNLSATQPGINVAGFFTGEYGIGEASRAFGKVIAETGLLFSLVNIKARDHRNLDASVSTFSKTNPYPINLMTFSFDYARRFYEDMGRRFFKEKYNIAVWYWELEKFPARWHAAFDYYDEIWAVSDFCRAAFAKVSPVPVTKITHPLYLSEVPANSDAFGLEREDCVFMFSFDFLSIMERKNPLAVIKAFTRAFHNTKDAILVLKSINSDRDPEGSGRVFDAIKGLNVRWLESHLSSLEMNTLFASIDCYVSLHRSEGLGLGMAQAMAHGKPVIATGYSGNLEFMNSGNSLLVDYKLVELERSYGPYEAGNYWADADTEHAAELMRWVYDHRDESRKLGERAAAEVQRRMNPLTSQQQILARIQEVTAGER